MSDTVFDISRAGASGPHFQDSDFPFDENKLNDWIGATNIRKRKIGLPELSEIEIVRHYTALSKNSHGVDNGTYPLGSCTMKYNPKRNDAMARMEGFEQVHPAQPAETMPGIWELFYRLSAHIAELMGMDHVTLQPAAGAHGELTGLMIIRRYFEHIGEKRNVVLVPDSAHGTNPASAAMAGYKCKIIPTDVQGLTDLDALYQLLDADVAAVMLTNPSTLGLFERNIEVIAEKVHANGSMLYYDGANMNALMGIVRPGDMGFDVVHINTHKTLSTPHGAGGPGSGPVGVKSQLEPFLPKPVIKIGDYGFFPDYDRPLSIGRMKSYFGHVSVLIRAFSYILTCGASGLHIASRNAVLNANYVQSRLSKYLPPVFDKKCMHECLLSGELLRVDSFDFAKRLIDFGLHPPTLVGAGCVYFPGDLKSAMLIEPTETETKEALDAMIDTFLNVIDEAEINPQMVKTAPHTRNVAKISAQQRGSL